MEGRVEGLGSLMLSLFSVALGLVSSLGGGGGRWR